MTCNGIVLLVEDNIKLNNANSRFLKLLGYKVYTALTLAEARAALTQNELDVILLDVMLPDGDGFDFCKEIRGATQAHILFLTAKTEHEDMVRGLTTGGDDYIMKPFHPEALAAKIAAAMRRRSMDKTFVKKLTFGNLTLDITINRAFIGDADLNLQPKEFALLLMFAENAEIALSAEYIYENIWKLPLNNDAGAVQYQVYGLRKKLIGSGYSITTKRGAGYVFEKADKPRIKYSI